MYARQLGGVLLLLFLGAEVRAQDVLTIGTGDAPAGGTASVPVFIRDRSGTPLGTDAGAGNRIQAFAFRVFFPTEIVTSITFSRAGIAAAPTPLHTTALNGTGWSSAVLSFNESSNPLPFLLNATAPGNQIGTLTVTLSASATAGSTALLTIDPPSAMLSNQSASVTETAANGNLALVNGVVTVDSNIAAPSGFVAAAVTTAQVNASWLGVGGADHYEVWRSSNGAAFALAASPSGTSYSDTNAAADTTYLYRIRAVNASGGFSPFSNVDAATTVLFTDDPLVPVATRIKVVHVTQLRTAVNAMRAAASLSSLGADPTIGAGALIRATHITALRTGLVEARDIAGLPPLTFADPTLTPGATPVKSAHVVQLRDGVK